MTASSRGKSATVLASVAALASAAALMIATTSDCPEPVDCRVEAPKKRPEPATPDARPTDPFAAMSAMKMVPVTARHDGVIDSENGMVFEATVSALDPQCDEEYCREGCYEFVAISQSETLEDLEVLVSSVDEPDSVLAQDTAPGPAVTAGFCFHYLHSHSGTLELRIKTRSRSGHGKVAVQGWLKPSSSRTIEEPPPVPGPATGTPLPLAENDPPAANLVRFMASDPHVPLAEVFLDELHAPPIGSCARWAAQPHRWLALDAWGQVVGTHRRTRAEAYDVTGCYEMETTPIRGGSGVGLLASVGYQAAPRFEVTPTDAQRGAFDRFIAQLDGVWPTELERAPMFFRGYDDALTAIVGGRVLAIAAFQDGDWHLRHIETLYSTEDYITESYRVLAVFDLDRDGNAEVVFRESEGPAWNDVVLSPGGTIWSRATTSVGGGTI